MLDGPPRYALQKALAVSRTSTILDSVVEVNVGKCKNIPRHSRCVFKIPYLLSPALFTLVKAIPGMQRLHTIRLDHIILSRAHLYTILSSPHLIHLTLDTVQIPKITKFPPPKLRELTLTAMFSWEPLEPLIAHLTASLECLELQSCEFWLFRPLQLPFFPCLRELRHHQNSARGTFPDQSKLNELFRLASQVTYLHLSGTFYYTRVAAFPKSLRHLSIEEGVLTEHIFGTHSMPWLTTLSIRCYSGWWQLNHRPKLPSFIRARFPEITSLHLGIPWSLRNFALVIARSQPNVHALDLAIDADFGLYFEERASIQLGHDAEVPADYLRENVLLAALETLKLDMVQTSRGNLEQSVTCCTRWIDDTVLRSVSGLGGPDLKGIDLSFVQRERKLERERVFWQGRVKSPTNDWQVIESSL
jgi:hypothetical protein